MRTQVVYNLGCKDPISIWHLSLSFRILFVNLIRYRYIFSKNVEICGFSKSPVFMFFCAIQTLSTFIWSAAEIPSTVIIAFSLVGFSTHTAVTMLSELLSIIPEDWLKNLSILGNFYLLSSPSCRCLCLNAPLGFLFLSIILVSNLFTQYIYKIGLE